MVIAILISGSGRLKGVSAFESGDTKIRSATHFFFANVIYCPNWVYVFRVIHEHMNGENTKTDDCTGNDGNKFKKIAFNQVIRDVKSSFCELYFRLRERLLEHKGESFQGPASTSLRNGSI